MSKSAPQISVLTANRLGDGIVVFLDFEGAWSESLAEAVVARDPDEARALEYLEIVLDTIPSMTEAQQVYERFGFRDIPAYRLNPIAGTRYLAKALAGP